MENNNQLNSEENTAQKKEDLTAGVNENLQTDNFAPVPKLGKNQIEYSKLEERMNIITHICGAGLAAIGALLMIIKVSLNVVNITRYISPALSVVAVAIYSFCLIELFTMSALYHAQPVGKTRRAVFRRFDHCSVALLIAGTYAPFMLIGLANSGIKGDLAWGIIIESLVVLMTVLVVVFNSINVHKFRVFSMISYIAMGWSCVIVITRIYAAIPPMGFWLLLAGGILYTSGILFYRIKRIKLNHAIWHFFVLAGSIVHFFSIYLYII